MKVTEWFTRNRVVCLTGVVLVAVLGVGAYVAFGLFGDNEPDSPPRSSSTVADLGFPDPDAQLAAETMAYLDGAGRMLLVMHEGAISIAGSNLDAPACSEAAVGLDTDAPADSTPEIAGGVPDDVLRNAFYQERTALGVTLTACIEGTEPAADTPDLADSVDVVAVRLAELEEAA